MNYQHLASAVSFFQDRGYVFIDDAPWVVSKEAYYATKPPNAEADIYVVGEGDARQTPRYHVASGEQSFIQIMLDGGTLKRALCLTPCHRVEKHDGWHLPYFMKVELINAQDVDEGHLIHMVHEAASFFERYFSAVRVKKTPIGYDIIEKGTTVELGSYGIRTYKDLRWIYGTGCAEPRLSTVLAKHSKLVGR